MLIRCFGDGLLAGAHFLTAEKLGGFGAHSAMLCAAHLRARVHSASVETPRIRAEKRH